MQYDSLKEIPGGGLASFLTSNLDQIEDNVLAFGAPTGINSMVDIGNRMASMGRNGDDQMVHMRTGEIAVSPELLEENPKLAGELANAFERSNVDMARYEVGNPANSLNPVTGQPEFFLKKLVKGIKNVFKKIAPVIVPIALNTLFPGLGTITSGALGSGIATLAQGGSFKDALKSAAYGGMMGGVAAGFGVGKGATIGDRAFGTGSLKDRFTLNPKIKDFFGGGADAVASTAPDAVTKLVPDVSDAATEELSFGQKLKKTLLPQGPTEDELLKKATSLKTKFGLTSGEAYQQAMAELKPGLMDYAPLALAGTAVAGAAGAFDTPEVDMSQSPYGISSREMYEQDPGKYSIFAGYRQPTPLVSSAPRSALYEKYVQPQLAAQGGEMTRQEFPRRNGFISGPGTETSDDVPAMLSDGEFVMTAQAVRGLGNGDRQQGVRKMYDLMRAFEGGAVA